MTNRKIHRWLSVVGIIFFLSVSLTGIWMQGEAIFGEDEDAREAMAEITSPASLSVPLPATAVPMDKARTVILARYGNRPVASVDWVIKAPVPAYVFHLEGAEPVRVTVNAATPQSSRPNPTAKIG